MSLLKLKDLNRRLDSRSTLALIPTLSEVFELSSELNSDYIRTELYRSALADFQRYIPLVRMTQQRIITPVTEFVDNFSQYASGDITSGEVTLIPSAVISLNGMLTGYRRFLYQEGCLHSVIQGTYPMNAHYLYPINEDYSDIDNKYTDKAAIGYVHQSKIELFLDQCMMTTIEYFIQVKRNFIYPDLPIEIFEGLDEKYSTLKQKVDEAYSGMTHGRIYR